MPTLTRFSVPLTPPGRFEQPLPGHPDPSHVTSFRLPCGSTPYSRNGLPGVFQPGAPLGFTSLQSLTLQKSSAPLGVDFPLLRSANRFFASLSESEDSKKATCLPGLQLIRTTFVAGLSRYTVNRGFLSESHSIGFRFTSRILQITPDIPLRTVEASLQGFNPSAGWDPT